MQIVQICNWGDTIVGRNKIVRSWRTVSASAKSRICHLVLGRRRAEFVVRAQPDRTNVLVISPDAQHKLEAYKHEIAHLKQLAVAL